MCPSACAWQNQSIEPWRPIIKHQIDLTSHTVTKFVTRKIKKLSNCVSLGQARMTQIQLEKANNSDHHQQTNILLVWVSNMWRIQQNLATCKSTKTTSRSKQKTILPSRLALGPVPELTTLNTSTLHGSVIKRNEWNIWKEAAQQKNTL